MAARGGEERREREERERTARRARRGPRVERERTRVRVADGVRNVPDRNTARHPAPARAFADVIAVSPFALESLSRDVGGVSDTMTRVGSPSDSARGSGTNE